MSRIDPWSLNEGDVFYECSMGVNLKFIADNVVKTDQTVRWQGLGRDNEFTDFLVTKGFEHYGPKIYSEPAYVRINNGNSEFSIK